MADAYRDSNSVPTLIASSNVDGKTPVRLYADPTTHRLLISTSATVNLATEQLTGTQSGTNVTLDLTGLAHTFTSILLVIMNGQILTPTSTWTRVGNTITIVNADAGSDYLVQYSY